MIGWNYAVVLTAIVRWDCSDCSSGRSDEGTHLSLFLAIHFVILDLTDILIRVFHRILQIPICVHWPASQVSREPSFQRWGRQSAWDKYGFLFRSIRNTIPAYKLHISFRTRIPIRIPDLIPVTMIDNINHRSRENRSNMPSSTLGGMLFWIHWQHDFCHLIGTTIALLIGYRTWLGPQIFS